MIHTYDRHHANHINLSIARKPNKTKLKEYSPAEATVEHRTHITKHFTKDGSALTFPFWEMTECLPLNEGDLIGRCFHSWKPQAGTHQGAAMLFSQSLKLSKNLKHLSLLSSIKIHFGDARKGQSVKHPTLDFGLGPISGL